MLPASTVLTNTHTDHVRLDWLSAAAALPGGKTLHLALLLQRLCAQRSSPVINLTRRMLALGHVSRDACYDGLRRLEKARLVSVRRLPGRSPQILLLEPGSVPGNAQGLQLGQHRVHSIHPSSGTRATRDKAGL